MAAVVTPTKASKQYQDRRLRGRLDTRSEKQEEAPHSRAKCQRCQKNILQGQERRGKNYDKGFRWWHVHCWDVYHHQYHQAPSARSTCRKCQQKIAKGTLRVEKEVYAGPVIGYTFHYYHVTCMTPDEQREMKLDIVPPSRASVAPRALFKTTKRDDKEPLRRELKNLRSIFAAKLSCQHFKIYSNDVVDELVQKLPQNNAQLLSVKGIGDKKVQSFGSAILTVIKQHLTQKHPQSTKITAFFQTKKGPQDVTVVETLSCEEIVARKFDEAEKNGYIIEVD